MWAVGLIYGTIRWLEVLAVALFVFHMTGSPFVVSLMLVIRMLPMMLLGGFIGVLAEKISRRHLLLGEFFCMASSCGVLAVLAATGHAELWHIGLGAFINGAIWSADYAVRRTLLGEIAGTANVGAAMSLDSATTNVTRMLGPLIGGVLYTAIGLPGTYLAGFILSGIAIYLIASMTYNPAPMLGRGSNFFSEFIEGLRYIRSNRSISMVLTITIVMNFFGFPFVAMVPVIGEQLLGLNPVYIGILVSAEGSGAFLGAIVAALFVQRAHYHLLYAYGAAVFLAAILIFSLSQNFSLSLIILLIAGFGVAGFSTMQGTIIFLEAPPEMRSRILGVLAVCIGVSPIGLLNIGWLAEWLGPDWAVFVASLGGLIAISYSLVHWRSLFQAPRPE